MYARIRWYVEHSRKPLAGFYDVDEHNLKPMSKKAYLNIYVPIRMTKADAQFLDKVAAKQNRSRADVVRELIRYVREFSLLVV